MVINQVEPFGVNAEQKYLQHLTNVNQVKDIYKLVEADAEYIDLFSNHKIEEVVGWGCRLLFNRPKRGIDHNIELSIHNPASGFERTVNLAYIDIPCKIDRLYYDTVHPSRWVDALGSEEGVAELETQLKDNLSTEISQDVNDEVEDALADKNAYRANTSNDMRKLIDGEDRFDGNMITLDKGKFSLADIISFLWCLSSKFKSRNRIFQKGYHADLSKARDTKEAWEQIITNTPSLKRIGVVCDSLLTNRLATEKMADTINTKYIDMENRFAYVKETNFKNVLKANMKHKDWQGYYDKNENKKGDKKWQEVYEKERLLVWIGDVRVPVLKIREPKQGLEYKYEVENGLHWFFLKSRAYVGLATCLNYFGIFIKTDEKDET